MVGSGHQIFEFVLLLLELDLACFLEVDEVVASDRQQVQLLYLILQHVLQLLDMGFVELVAVEAFFFK